MNWIYYRNKIYLLLFYLKLGVFMGEQSNISMQRPKQVIMKSSYVQVDCPVQGHWTAVLVLKVTNTYVPPLGILQKKGSLISNFLSPDLKVWVPNHSWNIFEWIIMSWIRECTFQTGPFICVQLVQNVPCWKGWKSNPDSLQLAITNGVEAWDSAKLLISWYLFSASLHHFLSFLQDFLRTNLH